MPIETGPLPDQDTQPGLTGALRRENRQYNKQTQKLSYGDSDRTLMQLMPLHNAVVLVYTTSLVVWPHSLGWKNITPRDQIELAPAI